MKFINMIKCFIFGKQEKDVYYQEKDISTKPIYVLTSVFPSREVERKVLNALNSHQ